MLKLNSCVPDLPPPVQLETIPVLRALSHASRALAELKGRTAAMPNQGMLMDTLALQEAKSSSEIENIVATQNALFQAEMQRDTTGTVGPAMDVMRYRDALKLGYARLRQTDGLITNNTLIDMFRLLKHTRGSFRNTPGTTLKSHTTGQVIYVPPQDARAIIAAMSALKRFINDDEHCSLDPLKWP